MDNDSETAWEAFGPEEPAPIQRTLGVPEWIVIGLGVVIAVGIIVLWPSGEAKDAAAADFAVLGVPSEFHEAVVVEVTTRPCPGTPDIDCDAVTFELTTGPDAGLPYLQEFSQDSLTPEFGVGDTVVLSRIPPAGRITALEDVPCDFDTEVSCTNATVTLYTGPDEGSSTVVPLFPGEEEGLFAGQDVMVTFDIDGSVIAIAPATMSAMYRFADFQRRSFLAILVIVFAVAVIALGRMRGVAALAGLGLSVLVVTVWLIPSMLDGHPAGVVALIGAATVAYVALYTTHGFNRSATIALLGTLAALTLTTLLAWVTTVLASFTGLATEEASLLLTIDGFDVRGLLLAGIVIGAAGALDDVTITQAAAIAQIRAASGDMARRTLFARGMAIGRAHVGSIVNTLVLAYLGAAMPLTILFILSHQSFGSVLNSEVVAVEVVRALVGTLGIIAAVPLTTWMATLWPSAHESH